jgi:hypothetical protein
MSENAWDDLLGKLDEAAGEADTGEWGESLTLAEGETFVGFCRGKDEWEGEYGRTPIYLLTDPDGRDIFHWGGRAQLDKRIAAANPQPGDRIAIRRLEDAPPAQPGRSPAWRIRVAVGPGDEVPF